MDKTPKATTPMAKVKKTAAIPAGDVDFAKVAKNVADKWTSQSWLTLKWTNQAEFAAKQTNYNTSLTTRQSVGSSRPQITKALKMVDKKTNDALSYVKGYLNEKYKKDLAPSYYASFGIEFINKSYVLPNDQNQRSAALKLMIDAIGANGFGTKEFGTTFWTAQKTSYDALLAQATGADSTVSSNVSTKNVLKADLKKTLNALIFMLKANYPDTYKAELRNWGMQKEKY